MAIINSQLSATQLDFTVPAGKTWAITNILVCNNSFASTANFDMHFIAAGDALSVNKTRVINNLALPGSETFTFDSERIVLDEGDSISFVADPNLSVTISYLEI